jgi:drug/metabolite transporter (DMT)-like permease
VIFQEGTMLGERALKVVLVVVGLLFVATVYPLLMFLWQPHPAEAALIMMLSVYVALGVFVLLAARNPSANRSLIAFTAWSSLAHAAVMVVQSFQMASERTHLLIGVAFLAVIGVALIVLAPARQSMQPASAVGS